jgi:Transposase DNA-binding/Transposase Tn5 dimerisation domain
MEGDQKMSWVADELKGVKLPDIRLKERLILMVERLSDRPEASLPQAMGFSADTKGAYRFLDSERVKPEDIREGCIKSSLKRIAKEKVILILQDTTMIDFSSQPGKTGLGYLATSYGRGLMMHTALACTTEGVPVGPLHQEFWTRAPENYGKSKQRRKRPFEEKESAKWVRTLQASVTPLPRSVRSITIADREADIFELFASERPKKADLLIRACRDRRVKSESGHLWETVMAGTVKGEIRIEVRGNSKEERTAQCDVRFDKVEISPVNDSSRGTNEHKDAISLWAVLVLEKDAPKAIKPLEWLLLTTLRVSSLEEALKYVKWYSLRWLVERYHLVLKSGCRIERLQLETAERLKRAIAVYSVVAWRILWLTYEARKSPEASCEVALEKYEWGALYSKIHKTKSLPSQPPGLRQAVRWIAQLGGFLGRKSDGEPGVMVIWRGMRRLADIADMWQLLQTP